MDVERLKVSAKRLVVSAMGEKRSKVALMFVHDANRIFGQYIRARILTSTLVFILSFIGFTAYGVPYATLFSLVGGITNIIPFYGPIIGFLIIVPLVLLISRRIVSRSARELLTMKSTILSCILRKY